MRYSLSVLFLISSATLFSQISAFDTSNCITDNDSFYYYEETLTPNEVKGFSLNEENQLRLKDGLTNQIISFIQSKSSLNLSSSRVQGEFTSSSVFSSFSQSDSNAIIFNPSYSLCKIENESGDTYKVYVYVTKESFDKLAISYFKSLTEILTMLFDQKHFVVVSH